LHSNTDSGNPNGNADNDPSADSDTDARDAITNTRTANSVANGDAVQWECVIGEL
jgi:hypothetical protein